MKTPSSQSFSAAMQLLRASSRLGNISGTLMPAIRLRQRNPCTRGNSSSASTKTQRRPMATVQNVDNIQNATPSKKYTVVVVGGGAAGISVASQLARYPAFKNVRGQAQILIIDPAEFHYYQPLWTFVGAGLKPFSESRKPMASVIPEKADWSKAKVAGFLPDRNLIITDKGEHIAYEQLVVAPGIQINWGNIKGLEAALGKDGVSSNYSEAHVSDTARFIKEFKGGNALFTQPSTPIKCAGAPQKIMYLAEEVISKDPEVRAKSNFSMYTGMGKIFAVDKYAASLWDVVKARNLNVFLNHDLSEVNPSNKTATFTNVVSKENVTVPYDFLHVTPPMSAPSFLKNSPEGFVNAAGWVNVDSLSGRHLKYENVWSLGDASSLPTSKTAAAAAAQSGVVVWNLLSGLEGGVGGAEYDGYTSCPLITGKNKLILAEFDYKLQPKETFIFNQAKQSQFNYWLTAEVIPSVYWNKMLKGTWTGPGQYRPLLNPFGL